MPKNLLDMLKDIKIQDLNRVVISPQGIVSLKTTTNEPPLSFCENEKINRQLQAIKFKDLNRVVFDGNGNVRLEPKREEQPTRPKKQVRFNLDGVSYNEPDEGWLIGPHSPEKAIDVAQRLEQEVGRTNTTQYYASMDSQQRILFRKEFIKHNPEGRKNILKVQEENDLKRLLESFTSIINNPEYHDLATQHRSLALDVEKELKAREIYSFVQKQVQERRLPQGAFDNSRLLDFARGVANNNGVFSYARKFDNSPQDMLVGALYQQYASIQYINQPEPLIQQQQPVVARTNNTQYYASMDSQQRILFREEFIRHNPEGRKNILKVQEENDLKRLLESFTSIINNPEYQAYATQHRSLALDVEKELKAREIYSFVQKQVQERRLPQGAFDNSRLLDFARGVANNNGVFSYARKFDNSPQDMLVGALYQQYASIQYINQPEPLIQQQQPVVARTNTTQYYASMDSQQRILFRKEFIRHNPEGRKNILKVQEENDLKRLLESFTSIINNPKYHDLATQHRGLALDVEKELKAREIYSFVQNNIKSSNLSLDSSRVDLNLMNYCRAVADCKGTATWAKNPKAPDPLREIVDSAFYNIEYYNSPKPTIDRKRPR